MSDLQDSPPSRARAPSPARIGGALAPAIPAPVRNGRELAVAGLIFGALALGLLALAIGTGWRDSLAALAGLGPLQVLALLALSLVNYLARALRWHLMARCLGLPVSAPQSLRHFLGGFAMAVTPARLGELVRMRWIRRETGWPVERSAPLMLADRASDMGVMALILAAALATGAGGAQGGLPVAASALLLAVLATRPALLERLALWTYRALGLWPRRFARARAAARSISRLSRPEVLLGAGALGLLGWLAEGVALFLLLDWMGAPLPLASAVAIFTLSTLAGGLTGLPGGLGGAEAAMLALLTLEGVPMAVAAPATLVIRLTTLWFAIGIGLLTFPLAERRSLGR